MESEEPLYDSVVAIVARVLSAFTMPGHAELMSQLPGLQLTPTGITTIVELTTSEGRPAPIPDGPLDVTGDVSSADGDEVGEMLVWVEAGWLSALEFSWWSEEPPKSLPTVDTVTVPAIRRTKDR